MDAISHRCRRGADVLPKDLEHVDLAALFRCVFVSNHIQGNMIPGRIEAFGSAFKITVLRGIELYVSLCFSHDQSLIKTELTELASDRSGKQSCLDRGSFHFSIKFRTPRLLVRCDLQHQHTV